MEIRKGSIGDEDVARIYTGDNIVHPLPVQDGLVLWYDFMGRRNSDAKRGIAEDLSGNGKDGELLNFAFEEGSGYENGLSFDGVDDYIELDNFLEGESSITLEVSFHHIYRNAYGGLLSARKSAQVGLTLLIRGTRSLLLQRNSVAQRYAPDNVINNEPTHFVVTLTSERVAVYTNGSLFGEELSEDTVLLNHPSLYIGTDSTDPSYSFNGSMFSYRIYNRELTPEEIAHNYAIEKERWNL